MLTYKIFIHPKDYKRLRNDIWSDEPVPGTLLTNLNKCLIDIYYRGNSIRKYKKRSYAIVFKKPFLIDDAHEIHLNAEFKDPSLIRNKLSLDFFNSIGVKAPKSEHILLNINGVRKGIFLQLESFDQYLLKKRNLPSGSIYYATDNDANFSLLTAENEVKSDLLQGYTAKYEKEEAEDEVHLFDMLLKINSLLNLEFYKEIQKKIDIDKYLTWLAGVVCTQNFDGFVHNYALYRNGDTGLFEITPWDFDGTWGRDRHGNPLNYDYIPITGYNTLTARLLSFSQFRHQYKKILKKILKHEFTIEYQAPLIESLCTNLKPYIKQDPYMKENIEKFEAEPEFIKEFIKNRNQYLSNELLRMI